MKEIAKPTMHSLLLELLKGLTIFGTETLLSSQSNKLSIAHQDMETMAASAEEWIILSFILETEELTHGRHILGLDICRHVELRLEFLE